MLNSAEHKIYPTNKCNRAFKYLLAGYMTDFGDLIRKIPSYKLFYIFMSNLDFVLSGVHELEDGHANRTTN